MSAYNYVQKNAGRIDLFSAFIALFGLLQDLVLQHETNMNFPGGISRVFCWPRVPAHAQASKAKAKQ
jgi:hypothetical protein